jgi:hypothetical protein
MAGEDLKIKNTQKGSFIFSSFSDKTKNRIVTGLAVAALALAITALVYYGLAGSYTHGCFITGAVVAPLSFIFLCTRAYRSLKPSPSGNHSEPLPKPRVHNSEKPPKQGEFREDIRVGGIHNGKAYCFVPELKSFENALRSGPAGKETHVILVSELGQQATRTELNQPLFDALYKKYGLQNEAPPNMSPAAAPVAEEEDDNFDDLDDPMLRFQQ